MRGRMNDGKSYAQPQPLGEVMIGSTAGVVVESKSTKFSVGDKVVGMGGRQEYSVAAQGMLRKVDHFETSMNRLCWLCPAWW